MGIEDLVAKAKDVVGDHLDVVEKAADAVKGHTDDATDATIDSVLDKAKGFAGTSEG